MAKKRHNPNSELAGNMDKSEKRVRHAQRLERLPRVAKLFLQGKSIREIAGIEAIPPRLIYGDIEYAKRMWRRRAEECSQELLSQEMQKINLIETQAWEEWERSKEDAVSYTRERDADKKVRKKRVVTGQCGDPRYLQVALSCVDKRCKLLKIGEYGNEETGMLTARVVEVVVETAEQVNRMMNYTQFEELLEPSDN